MKLKKTKNKLLALLLVSLNLVPIFNPISYATPNKKSSTQIIHSKKDTHSLHGFSLKKSFSVGKHDILEYQHEKSGMWLVIEKNNNIDKTFEIMVRTPPENDKGINHIIEHCVLNGSDEYPCKNILWELHQMSYNTFLNALTWPCYTAFPVASIDEDELFSLAKIYTSGIFHPAFLKDERIFKKEGIRFELDRENKLIPNGTVFNEMQGNNPDVLNSILKTVFPDTQGKNVSGGIPEKIMDLSYEEVCNTYKKYYHPSNMVAYMSGNINYERFMKFLNEEYLKNYSKINLDHVKYSAQDTSKLPKEKTAYYYKQATDKNIISANIVSLVDYPTYVENEYNLNVLSQIINNESSERTKFLKSKGYLEISCTVLDLFYDPTIMISLCSEREDLVSPENTKKILKELFEKYPISESEIEAITGSKDFNERLNKNTELYDSCLDSGHFIKSFIKFGDPCAKTYFDMLEKHIKHTPAANELNDLSFSALEKWHKTIITLKPSYDKSLSSKERLQSKIDSLQDQKDKLTENYEKQKAWAEEPNSDKQRNQLKKMFKKLSKINTPKLNCKLDNKKIQKINCYHSSQDIGDFISYKLVFSLNNLSSEELQYMELLGNALNKNNTQKHSREELNKLKSNCCQISSKINVTPTKKNSHNASLVVSIVTNKENCDKTIALAAEQCLDVNFKDNNALKEFLTTATVSIASTPKATLKFYDRLYREISPLYNYLNANHSDDHDEKFYNEITSKLSDEKFINTLADKLSALRDKIFNVNNLQGAGICASRKNQKVSEDKLKKLLKNLGTQDFKKTTEIKLIPSNTKNIACVDPSTSNNNIICIIDSKELCKNTDFEVTCRIITDKFLAPKVREKSGAYGAKIYRLPDTNKIIISSYCDPNIKSSIDIFKSIPEFIKNLNIENSEIENTSKSLLGHVFPKNKLNIFSNQIENLIGSQIDYCKKINTDVDSIKNITVEKIKKHGEILKDAMSNMRIYVVSSDRKNLDEKMFDEIFE